MRFTLEKSIPLILITYTIIYSLILVGRVYNFSIGTLDLTNYTQAIWKIANHLPPVVTSIGVHTLIDHFCLLWYPLALIFKIWPSPYWLLILHAAAITGTAGVLYAIGKECTGDKKIAFLLMLAYLFSEYTQRAMMSPIHPDSFSGLLISAALFFMIREKPGWYFMFFALSLVSNEDVGLYFAGVGLYLVLCKKQWRWGWATFVLSLVWFMLIFKFKTFIGVDTTGHISRFSHFGNSLPDILKNVILKPWIVPLNLLHMNKLSALSRFFLQVGFLPLLSPCGLLLLATPLLFKSLTNHVGMYNYWDHYSMVVQSFLWTAAALGMKNILTGRVVALEEKERTRLGLWIASMIFAINLCVQAFLPYSPVSFRFDWKQVIPTQESRNGAEIIKSVPEDASVLTQESVSQSLAMRREIYVLFGPNLVPDGVPKWQPDYVVLDRDRFTGNWLEKDLRAADAFFSHSKKYLSFKTMGNWVVYKRT